MVARRVNLGEVGISASDEGQRETYSGGRNLKSKWGKLCRQVTTQKFLINLRVLWRYGLKHRCS